MTPKLISIDTVSDGNGSCIPTNVIVDRTNIQADFNYYKDIIHEDLCKYLFGLKIDNSLKESYAVSSEVLGVTLCLTIQGKECFVERSTGASMELKVIHGSTACSFTELADRDLFIGERILDLVERTAHYITSKLVELTYLL